MGADILKITSISKLSASFLIYILLRRDKKIFNKKYTTIFYQIYEREREKMLNRIWILDYLVIFNFYTLGVIGWKYIIFKRFWDNKNCIKYGTIEAKFRDVVWTKMNEQVITRKLNFISSFNLYMVLKNTKNVKFSFITVREYVIDIQYNVPLTFVTITGNREFLEPQIWFCYYQLPVQVRVSKE